MNTLGELHGGKTTEHLTRTLDQLRVPWTIALAEATAVLAYLFAAPLWQALAAGAAVLAVRLGVGKLLPVREATIPPRWVLTNEEQAIAALIGARFTDAEIADRREVQKKAVVKRVERIQTKLGLKGRQEVGDWAVLVGLVDPPPRPPKPPYDHPFVRSTLAGAGFISLGWTTYNITKTIWPDLFAR